MLERNAANIESKRSDLNDLLSFCNITKILLADPVDRFFVWHIPDQEVRNSAVGTSKTFASAN
jgi:hypothetical protein